VDCFVPRPSLAGGHKMTIYGWGNPRYFPRLPESARRYFDVDAESRVVADCHWQQEPWRHATLLALHGLNGSSDAHYMRGLAAKAFERGLNVVRLNQRNCGGTERLSAGLFHSGLTADAAHVIDELMAIDRLPAIAVAGYSLGGNLALKLAGEYGEYAPPGVLAIAAVSPIVEIAECVSALEQPGNALYQWNFVRDLKRRMRRKVRHHPGHFDLMGLRAVRTVRQFDEAFTAKYFGFRDADDYYRRASALRNIDRIRVPTLVLTAEDDPFVPIAPFRDPKIASNAHIDLRISPHGGHCGFIGPRQGGDDGYWAENRIVEFVERQAGDRLNRNITRDRGLPSDVSRTPGPFPALRA
jgi:predicted alpha/beta-fold hydrolase